MGSRGFGLLAFSPYSNFAIEGGEGYVITEPLDSSRIWIGPLRSVANA